MANSSAAPPVMRLISNVPICKDDFIADVTTYQGSLSLLIHAKGFLELAEISVERASRNATAIDAITPSIIYAIRHATELFLKHVITELDEKHFKRTSKLGGHDIGNLFAQFRTDISDALGYESEQAEHSRFDYKEWLRVFENIISEIVDIDPDGQTLRYPTTMKGRPNLGGKMQVSLMQVAAFAQHTNRCFSDFVTRCT